MSETENISASDLLRQWHKACEERKREFERRNNWMLPRLGIEEMIVMQGNDLIQLGWFLDKALKLLAAQETGTGRATVAQTSDCPPADSPPPS